LRLITVGFHPDDHDRIPSLPRPYVFSIRPGTDCVGLPVNRRLTRAFLVFGCDSRSGNSGEDTKFRETTAVLGIEHDDTDALAGFRIGI
jgi:hypothetical protein